jgi:hypothetical protein
MKGRGDPWYDEAAGPLVRPYAVTGGRTRSARPDLNIITLVVTVQPVADTPKLDRECLDILDACRYPLSVAEVSAKLHLPLAVTKILVADLVEQRRLIFRAPAPPAARPAADLPMLQKVLDGIRRI